MMFFVALRWCIPPPWGTSGTGSASSTRGRACPLGWTVPRWTRCGGTWGFSRRWLGAPLLGTGPWSTSRNFRTCTRCVSGIYSLSLLGPKTSQLILQQGIAWQLCQHHPGIPIPFWQYVFFGVSNGNSKDSYFVQSSWRLLGHPG